MTAAELLSLANQILFAGLFLAVLRHAVRERSRASVNTAMLFGAIAGIVVVARVTDLTGQSGEPWAMRLTLLLLATPPYAMIRLVEDFSDPPPWVQYAGTAAYVLVAGLSAIAFPQFETAVGLLLVAFYALVGGYAAVTFAREARRAAGITRRRMAAVAIGAGLFICAILLLLGGALLPDAPGTRLLAQIVALAAVVAFFLGFVPPTWVRQAWREPDLRRFLERSIHLTGVADDRDAVQELQRAAADAFGARGASIGLANEENATLRYVAHAGGWVEHPQDAFIGGHSFTHQRRVVAADAAEADPANAAVYERIGARTVIAAPMSTEERRVGVLAIYAERAPIFIEDDLWLLELLASQAAVLLEARSLTAHASQLKAREEAARLKEEFLSAAAHDLRTPLTVVLGQAELLERRLERRPDAPVDRAGVSRMAREARRLRDLVTELLDAQRLEDGHVVMEMQPVDLCELVETVYQRQLDSGVSIGLDRPDEPLVASVDRARLEQVVENLVENAVKYGGERFAPKLRVEAVDGEGRISVIDHGTGIPEGERDRVFERFYRASNAGGVTDTGLGLGLYICRRIVEEHRGRIWLEPTDGGGSTFRVSLPLEPQSLADAEELAITFSPRLNGGEALADA